MRENVRKFNGGRIVDAIKAVLSSPVFPFFTGAYVMLFYYLGWDLATIYFLGVFGTMMLLFLDDLTPLVPHLLFLHIIISMQNTPTNALEHNSQYYMQPAILGQILTIIGVALVAIGIRIFLMAKDKSFKPTRVFVGLCIFAFTLLLNGAFTKTYTFANLLYGLILAACFVAIFVLISSNAKSSDKNYKLIGWGFVAFSLVLVTELIAKYVANGTALFDGEGQLEREMFVFGWGIWNTMGMLLVISIPGVMILASKYKWGFPFIFYGLLLAVCAFLTASRQSMVGALIIYPCSLIVAIIKTENRLAALISTAVIAVGGSIALWLNWAGIVRSLGSIMDNLFGSDGAFTGNGRIPLMEHSVIYFLGAPVFGGGFHLDFSEYDVGFVGLDGFVPTMAHNTFAELLATCGLLGFLAYILHRIQTIVAFSQNVTDNKIYIAMSVSIMLILSLLDNHIFYIFPTIIYSMLLPFATGELNEGKPILFASRFKRKCENAAEPLPEGTIFRL